MSHFGLDIGTQSIKVAALGKAQEKWSLMAAGIASTPLPGISSDSERVLISVSDAIRKLCLDAKITEKNVVFALSENYVYTRLVSFPPLSDTEVASAVEWQIESYIPLPKRDAVYDHQIITKSEKSTQVFIIATPKKIVDRYIKVLQMANLVPVAVETELIALARSIAPEHKRALILDFGASSADIAVAVNKNVVFSRSIPTGGEALTRAIAQTIGVQPAQAEEYKRMYGLSSAQLEGKVKQALDPVMRSILDEFKKAIVFWQTDHPDQPIETLVVTGGTAGLPEIAPVLAEYLGLEVNVGDPFINVLKNEQTAKALVPYAPLYAVVVGLAMREGE